MRSTLHHISNLSARAKVVAGRVAPLVACSEVVVLLLLTGLGGSAAQAQTVMVPSHRSSRATLGGSLQAFGQPSRGAVASPVAGATAVLRGGGFGGPSSQGDVVALRLSANGRRVASFAISWDATCSDGLTHLALSRLRMTVPVSRGGRFQTHEQSVTHDGDEVDMWDDTVTGQVGRSSVSGTFHGRLVIKNAAGVEQATCDSGPVTWRAPRAYAGSTAQGHPVVVQVTRNRRAITRFLVGWFGDCADGSSLASSASLPRMSVGRNGTFGDGFTADAGRDEVTVAGRLTAARVVGVLRWRGTASDAAGNPVACDSRDVGLNARI